MLALTFFLPLFSSFLPPILSVISLAHLTSPSRVSAAPPSLAAASPLPLAFCSLGQPSQQPGLLYSTQYGVTYPDMIIMTTNHETIVNILKITESPLHEKISYTIITEITAVNGFNDILLTVLFIYIIIIIIIISTTIVLYINFILFILSLVQINVCLQE